jgi:PAS domain S-box-containing protein
MLNKFSVVLLLALIVFGFALEKTVSSTLRRNMTDRAAEMAANFLHHELNAHLPAQIFPQDDRDTYYQEIAGKIARLTRGADMDVRFMKIWDSERRLVWTATAGDRGGYNTVAAGAEQVYLGRAFARKIPVDSPAVERDGSGELLELLIPVRQDGTENGSMVVGVYTTAGGLMADIDNGSRTVRTSVIVGSLVLYLLLLALFRGASRKIEQQNMRLMQSEDRYRNLIYCAQEGIVSVDKQGRILLMNETAELIFGCSGDAHHPGDFTSLLVLDDNDELRCQLDQFFATGDCCAIGKNFESKGRRLDGEIFPLEISLSVSGEEDSCILTGLIRDITQRDRLFEQLATAKQEWEETFNTINDAITIHDRDFTITRANRAAETMLGRPMQNILGQKCYRSYHGTENPPGNCPSCETMRSGIMSISEVYEPHLEKYLEVKALPRLNAEKRLAGVVHVVRDITDPEEGGGETEQAAVATQPGPENGVHRPACRRHCPRLQQYTLRHHRLQRTGAD